jgi:hypothetical protein
MMMSPPDPPPSPPLQRILARALVDAGFRHELFNNFDNAVQGYHLPPHERTRLSQCQEAEFDPVLQSYQTHLSARFI